MPIDIVSRVSSTYKQIRKGKQVVHDDVGAGEFRDVSDRGFASHGAGIRATSAKFWSALASFRRSWSFMAIRARHRNNRSFVRLIPVTWWVIKACSSRT
jgi:hypothetical protein